MLLSVILTTLVCSVNTKTSYTSDGSLFSSDEFDYDERDHKAMGSIFSKFLADSGGQAVLDLDLFQHFFNYHEAYRQGAEDGNLEVMKYAVELVEKMKKFDVSTACVADMLHLAWTGVEYATHVEEHRNCSACKCTPLFQQKKSERHWIFTVLDSIGKVPAGITSGNNLWVGSWSTCRKIKVVKNRQGQMWKGQYCLANIHAYERDNPLKNLDSGSAVDEHCFLSEASTSTAVLEDEQCFNLFPLLKFGICMPDTCTEYDVKKMLTFAIRATETMSGMQKVCNVSVECRVESQTDAMSENRLAMLALYLLIATIVLMIFGTLYDLFVIQNNLNHTNHPAIDHKFIKLLVAFSVFKNGQDVMKSEKKDGEINCLHGVRVLSMCWIILGHTYYYIGTSLTTDNLIPTLINFPKQFYTQIIVQAPLAVDSFFFLSGMIAAYLMFKKELKPNPSQKKEYDVLDAYVWPMYTSARLLRILPTYVIVMLFDTSLFPYISDGPFWRPIEKGGCSKTWWINLLFVNNLFMQDVECCMGWTWYLANDMQFHLLLFPILIIVTLKLGWKLGGALGLLLITASSIIKLVIIQVNDYPPAPLLTAKLQIVKNLDSYWNDVYIRPYIRCTPFVIGVFVAYLLLVLTPNQANLKYKMQKRHVIYGWCASTVLGIYSVFGLYWFSKTGDISKPWEVLYILFGRPAFTLALAWVVFACTTGNGGPVGTILSWRFFVPLSKITFCAYLIHPIMLQIYNLSRPQPFHFTTFGQMLRHAIEAVLASYIVGFFFVLAFEKPYDNIIKLIFPKLDKKKSSTASHNIQQELQPLKSTNGKNNN